jgi:hypothetical protein
MLLETNVSKKKRSQIGGGGERQGQKEYKRDNP